MPTRRFVMCIVDDAGADLLPRTVYRVLPDAKARAEKMLRVIDGSGEGYLYPANMFVPVDVPRRAFKVISGG